MSTPPTPARLTPAYVPTSDIEVERAWSTAYVGFVFVNHLEEARAFSTVLADNPDEARAFSPALAEPHHTRPRRSLAASMTGWLEALTGLDQKGGPGSPVAAHGDVSHDDVGHGRDVSDRDIDDHNVTIDDGPDHVNGNARDASHADNHARERAHVEPAAPTLDEQVHARTQTIAARSSTHKTGRKPRPARTILGERSVNTLNQDVRSPPIMTGQGSTTRAVSTALAPVDM